MSRARYICVIVALSAVAGTIARPASAEVISWNAGTGSWYDSGNWTPSQVPGSSDAIYIGNLPHVSNDTVLLGGQLTAGYDHLEVSSGMTLDLNGTELVSFGEAWITGANSLMIVRPQPLGPNQQDFNGELHLGAQAQLQLTDNVEIRLFTGSVSSGRIFGQGRVRVASAIPFINNGIIEPSPNGGITMNHGQPVTDQPVDLDGTTGNGQLQLNIPFSVLEVNAGNLSDPFSGSINMVPGSLLTMNIIDGWAADSDASVMIAGSNNPAAASMIDGETFTFGGNLSIADNEGHLRVLAPTVLTDTTDVDLYTTAWLEWDGETAVNGGDYTLARYADMDFDGPVTMSGGTFQTYNQSTDDGSISFNGPTAWSGTVTINGAASQNGAAEVVGSTTLNAGMMDMDGAAGDTVWDIIANFIVNADQIDSTAGNRFTGTLDIAGGFLPRLSVNLSSPGAVWKMDGTLNLSGLSHLFETRLSGSPIEVEGDVNVTGGHVVITADMTLQDTGGGALLNIGPDDAELRFAGQTIIREGVSVAGMGTLQNGSTGEMTLDDGVSLGGVGLLNAGLLETSTVAGTATMERFVQSASGTWVVDLGGYGAGTDHDVIVTTGGGATLDGELQVNLLGTEGGRFQPQVGDQFTIISTVRGTTGAFSNNPVSTIGTLVYEWSVRYGRYDVILQLDNVTTECSDYDEDGDVDLDDVALFEQCMGGSRHGSPHTCPLDVDADCDGDSDVDLADYARLMNSYTANPSTH